MNREEKEKAVIRIRITACDAALLNAYCRNLNATQVKTNQ